MNGTEQGWYFCEMRWNDKRRMEWKKYELMREERVDADIFFLKKKQTCDVIFLMLDNVIFLLSMSVP